MCFAPWGALIFCDGLDGDGTGDAVGLDLGEGEFDEAVGGVAVVSDAVDAPGVAEGEPQCAVGVDVGSEDGIGVATDEGGAADDAGPTSLASSSSTRWLTRRLRASGTCCME